MNESVLLAIIAIVVPMIAVATGVYTAYQSRHTRHNEADEVRAKTDEIVERVRAMQWEREQAMIARLGQLEKDRRELADRLEAIEMELHLTRKRYEDDLIIEKRKREELALTAKRVQESLETELQQLREMVDHLTKENTTLQAKIKQLASRVETGELGSGGHKRKP